METENRKVPAEIECRPPSSLFGAPTLIPGEKLADYEDLQRRVANSVKPKDVIEEMLVHDVVYLAWEILRLRRLKDAFLTSIQPQGVEEILRQVLREGVGAPAELAKEWAARDPKAMKKVDKLLRAKGLSMEVAVARGLAANIGPFERLDTVISNLEMRRNTALRELDRHRAGLGSAVRRAADEVVDADFEDVTPAPSGQREAA